MPVAGRKADMLPHKPLVSLIKCKQRVTGEYTNYFPCLISMPLIDEFQNSAHEGRLLTGEFCLTVQTCMTEEPKEACQARRVVFFSPPSLARSLSF